MFLGDVIVDHCVGLAVLGDLCLKGRLRLARFRSDWAALLVLVVVATETLLSLSQHAIAGLGGWVPL